MSYAGIDYSLGRSNVNLETGIHYGVISPHSINPEAMDDFENDYGTPHCPECGNDAVEIPSHSEQLSNGVVVHNDIPAHMEDWEQYRKYGCADYACETCEHMLDSQDVFSDESLGWSYTSDGYKLTDCLDNDIFILESPYYTFAQFCSPCVPGAGNLDNPCEDGPKTYALGHDWFEDGKAPYPVYRVSDNALVKSEEEL